MEFSMLMVDKSGKVENAFSRQAKSVKNPLIANSNKAMAFKMQLIKLTPTVIPRMVLM